MPRRTRSPRSGHTVRARGPLPGRGRCSAGSGSARGCAPVRGAGPAPPQTHLPGDAGDKRHLPGLAHVAIPGAPGARAARRRLCHVAAGGRTAEAGRAERGLRSGAGRDVGVCHARPLAGVQPRKSAPRRPPPQSDRARKPGGEGRGWAGRGEAAGGRRVLRVSATPLDARGRPRPRDAAPRPFGGAPRVGGACRCRCSRRGSRKRKEPKGGL